MWVSCRDGARAPQGVRVVARRLARRNRASSYAADHDSARGQSLRAEGFGSGMIAPRAPPPTQISGMTSALPGWEPRCGSAPTDAPPRSRWSWPTTPTARPRWSPSSHCNRSERRGRQRGNRRGDSPVGLCGADFRPVLHQHRGLWTAFVCRTELSAPPGAHRLFGTSSRRACWGPINPFGRHA